MTYEAIRYELADHVATVTLDRPDVHNAMNNAMRRELTEVFTRLATEDTVRVVLVTGAGERAFSAGADIREFVEPLVPTQFREERRRIDFRQAMDRCPQPIIAAIRGYAFGGGLELALACDIRIAADDAQLGLTEINLAIIPGGGGTQRLPRLVGRGKALEMILTGMRVPAEEALRIGLVERVVPEDQLWGETMGIAETISQNAPLAIKAAKLTIAQVLKDESARDMDAIKAVGTACMDSADFREGRQAFMEKRKPQFQGR